MSDQQAMAQVASRAEQAKRLLTDPLFVEARQTLESQLKDLICTLPLGERDQRERAVAMLKGSEQFFRIFELIVFDYDVMNAEMLNEEQIKARHQAIQEQLNNV